MLRPTDPARGTRKAAPNYVSANGAAIGSAVIVLFQVAGTVILGLFALVTQGTVTIIEERTARLREHLFVHLAGRSHARVTDVG